MIGLHTEEFCYDIFVANKLFDFFWNVFTTKAIKICYNITICIQCYPVCLDCSHLDYYVGPILYSVC